MAKAEKLLQCYERVQKLSLLDGSKPVLPGKFRRLTVGLKMLQPSGGTKIINPTFQTTKCKLGRKSPRTEFSHLQSWERILIFKFKIIFYFFQSNVASIEGWATKFWLRNKQTLKKFLINHDWFPMFHPTNGLNSTSGPRGRVKKNQINFTKTAQTRTVDFQRVTV